jgi:hypothetical protein
MICAQPLEETDLGGVIAVKGQAFYDAKKIAGELLIMSVANVRMGVRSSRSMAQC